MAVEPVGDMTRHKCKRDGRQEAGQPHKAEREGAVSEIVDKPAKVAVEINANPHRLDLDWRWYRRPLDLGCMLSINPDAHSTEELDLTHWGVAVARKGAVPKERVLNCLNLDSFAAFVRKRKTPSS